MLARVCHGARRATRSSPSPAAMRHALRSMSSAQQHRAGDTHKVTLMAGDGVGPEVVGATKRIVEATGVKIDWEEAAAGAKVFKKGIKSGVPQDTIDSITRTGVALKGPLETPVGYGEKSANVTLRKLFELFGNTRPCKELPGVGGPFAGRGIDLMVVRENVEDLYAGIEHMQTPGVAQCLKLISRKGCEKIIRLAFELAEAEGRSKVHCATKANIMKMTEGLMKRTFEEIAPEYPHIQSEHIIIDNCAHQLVRNPEDFDVIVTSNMNGDILSDLTSGLTGGLGIAPSANLGSDVVMFEAVHGSAPHLAGQNLANPTAILLSSVMMLRHLNEFDAARTIEEAVYTTYAEGKNLTGDIDTTGSPATTDVFADTVISNFGKQIADYVQRDYKPITLPRLPKEPGALVKADTWQNIGADVFLWSAKHAEPLGDDLVKLAEGTPLKLKMISNRGTKVYPVTAGQTTDCVDHWRCRFIMRDGSADMSDADLNALLTKIAQGSHRWVHIEKLPLIDGKEGFTRAQGED